MATAKVRESNVELFRIITMLLIVAHHYVANSGLMVPISQNPTSLMSLFYLLFGAWGKTGINCFVLITGYFMCCSSLSLRKYLKLLLEVYFYRFAVYMIFLVAQMESFSVVRVLKMLLPFSSITDGFTNCFLAFYLFIPFLNTAINAMSKMQHALLVFLLLVVYTLLPTIPTIQTSFNYVTWFIVLYFIGSYLRLYSVGWIEHRTGTKLVLTVAVACLSIVALAYYVQLKGKELYGAYYLVSDSNKLFALLIAVLAFSFFRNLKIGYCPWINYISASTFGVLLIHANSDAMRVWLWRTTLHNRQMYESRFAVLHAFLSVLAVFAACVAIDRIRIIAIEKPFFKLYDKIEPWIRYKLQLFRSKLTSASEK